MTRRLALLAALVGGITLVGAAGAATPAPTTGSDGIHVAPVTRLPFPERGYVVSVPKSTCARHGQRRRAGERAPCHGRPCRPARGQRAPLRRRPRARREREHDRRPATAALAAGRTFLTHRSATEEIGIVAFNGEVSVLSKLTKDGGALRQTLEDAAAARLRDAHPRRDRAFARAPTRREALVRVDRAALGRCRHRQPPNAGAGGRRGEGAAGAHLHRRSPLGCVRRGPAPLARRAHRRLVRRSPLGSGARGDLRGARHPARRRVPRPLPLGRAPDVAGRGADRGRRARERRPRRMWRRRRRCWRPTTVRQCRRSCSPAARRSCSPSSSGCSSAGVLLLVTRRPKTTVVDRVESFASASRGTRADNTAAVALRAATRNRYATGWWAELEQDLELARMTVTAPQVVGMALAGTFAIFVIAPGAFGAAPRPLRPDDAADRRRSYAGR